MAEKKENRRKAAAKTQTNDSAENFTSEINEARWSVVSFDECVAKNLTYDEASERLKQLAAQKVSGLCIITDEAAERI